jgi:anti-sigma factor RsiW
MNPSNRDDKAAREWALQEDAFDAERRGDVPDDDARLARYRAVARALREPMTPMLPPDFAQQMARRVRNDEALAGSFEQRGAIAMIVLLALSGLVYLGAEGIAAAFAAMPGMRVIGNSWVMAFAACVAVSFATQRWARPTT